MTEANASVHFQNAMEGVLKVLTNHLAYRLRRGFRCRTSQ